MKSRAPLSVAALLAAAAVLGSNAPAGVTGVPGINDYTINGCLSGSTSCGSCLFVSPITLNFTVSTAPSLPVIYAFTACPCFPDFAFLAPVPCLLPFTSFSGASNQSIDLSLGCPLITATGVSSAAGISTLSVSLPLQTVPLVLSTQAVVIGLPCGSPAPFVATQSYRLTVL